MYKALKKEAFASGDAEEEEFFRVQDTPFPQRPRDKRTIWCLGILLALSIFLHTLNYTTIFVTNRAGADKYNYAGLLNDREITIGYDTRSIDDEFWTDDRHNIYTGMIAVNDEFVNNHGLPESQPYPWDPSRSIYYLSGFHSMHCVLILRDAVMEARDGRNQSWGINHLTHCLHTLREDVECYADDTPLYTGRFNAEKHAKIVRPGRGQPRVCRDWDQLRKFAIENTACWDQRPLVPKKSVLENYKHCPDGSKPWENPL